MATGKTIHWLAMGLAGIVLLGSGFWAPPYVTATLVAGAVGWAAAAGGLRGGLIAAAYCIAVLWTAYLRHPLPVPWFYLACAVLLGTGTLLGRVTDSLRLKILRLEEARIGTGNEKNKLETILDLLPDVTFAVDSRHRVILWNRAAEKLTGVKKEEILGRAGYEHGLAFYGSRRPTVVDVVLGDTLNQEDNYEKLEKIEDTLLAEGFAPLPRGDSGLAFWSVAAPLYGPDGKIDGAVQSIRDIGERKKAEVELRHLGTHDALTGLCNRAHFQKMIQELSDGPRPVSVIVCDVDCLKKVNDTFGHLKGDEILRRAAAIIAGELRSTDCVARVGGDEFAVLLPDTDKNTAKAICRRLRERVAKDNLDHPGLILGISAGSATTVRTGEPLEDILKMADEAMYRQKALRGMDHSGKMVITGGAHPPDGNGGGTARIQGGGPAAANQTQSGGQSALDGEGVSRMVDGNRGSGPVDSSLMMERKDSFGGSDLIMLETGSACSEAPVVMSGAALH
ncbi:MAG TPA: diguanylate cyclase [Spirochaetia bacterium]|nr:diguanylate cyclase [Spirochaetia bacterium]